VPGPAGRAAAALFGTVARLRGDRAVHPQGVALEGTFEGSGPGMASGLFSSDREHAAMVRFSRGGGLPKQLPDVLGCAIRVVDAHGSALHQDFVLAGAARPPVARHVLVPGRDLLGAFYSSLLPYRIAGGLRLMGARVEPASHAGSGRLDALPGVVLREGLTVRLLTASPVGPWREVATVAIDAVLTGTPAARLRFNPWNTGGDIQPVGTLMALRDPAYRASQAAAPR
jgi:hypothetical protein